MKTIYKNTNVVLDDIEDRLEEGKEMSVQMKYESKENTFSITIPKARKTANKVDKDAPQLQPIFEGLLSGVKGSITARGNAKVSLDMPPAKIKAIGIKAVKNDLVSAYDAVIGALAEKFGRCAEAIL